MPAGKIYNHMLNNGYFMQLDGYQELIDFGFEDETEYSPDGIRRLKFSHPVLTFWNYWDTKDQLFSIYTTGKIQYGMGRLLFDPGKTPETDEDWNILLREAKRGILNQFLFTSLGISNGYSLSRVNRIKTWSECVNHLWKSYPATLSRFLETRSHREKKSFIDVEGIEGILSKVIEKGRKDG